MWKTLVNVKIMSRSYLDSENIMGMVNGSAIKLIKVLFDSFITKHQ